MTIGPVARSGARLFTAPATVNGVKRLVALVVAIGLVVVAVVIRRAIDDDTATVSTVNTPATDQPTAPGTGKVLCASDLGRLCDELDLQKEAPAETLKKIRSGDVTFDTWVTAAPWADLANASTNVFGKLPKPVAASPLQFYVVQAKTGDVTQACGAAPNWACVTAPGTRNFFAYDNPVTTTAGLLSLVQLAASVVKTTDFGTNDFAQFESVVASIKRAQSISPSVDSALVDNGVQGFAAAAIVTAIEAVATKQSEAAQLKNKYLPAPATPLVAAELLVVTRAGVKAAIGNDRVKSEALKLGWKEDVPGRSTLPAADVLVQLQALWMRLQ